MQLSNMQLTVQFSYWMAGIGYWFLKFYAIKQYMQLSNMQLSDTVCNGSKASSLAVRQFQGKRLQLVTVISI